ncbi:MAG: hypothetical protein AB1346_05070 [Thermodesulfobacteriota bacterium]
MNVLVLCALHFFGSGFLSLDLCPTFAEVLRNVPVLPVLRFVKNGGGTRIRTGG